MELLVIFIAYIFLHFQIFSSIENFTVRFFFLILKLSYMDTNLMLSKYIISNHFSNLFH